MRTRGLVSLVGVASMLLAGCSSQASDEGGDRPSGHDHEAGHENAVERAKAPLRGGERFVDVTMPAAYTPKAPTTGTDDYRCFLLDPGLTKDAFLTGLDVVPGNTEVVHHVILFRVPPGQVANAESYDAATPGPGWTCFGGSGLDGGGASLDNAPWLGAWAPGGGESVMAPDLGVPMKAGSRIVLQVHYNLLAGSEPDVSSARLRMAPGTRDLNALETMLLPGPVELPCRPGVEEPLCDRAAAVADVRQRFGEITGATGDFLNMICAGKGAGPTQTCRRRVSEPATIRAVAGHMHLLGRKISIEVNPGRPDAKTVLDIPVWDFDDQGSRPVAKPVRIGPGDELEVRCTHDQSLRDRLPAFRGQKERYVVWGEGTTDEMCLGIVLVTRP